MIALLSQASLVVGLMAALSYGAKLHTAVRMRAPAAGAWWNAHEFYLMEGAATALGLLLALRIGLRLAVEADRLCYPAAVTLALDAALLLPLSSLCARLARIGADGDTVVVPDRIAAFVGFAPDKLFDNLLTVSLYFVKTAAFASLLGLALFAAVLVGAIVCPSRHGAAGLDSQPDDGPTSEE
jgi:hypothetical protein